jgi:deazaflavin-dependent oxidoreductase (nitroreductase family)
LEKEKRGMKDILIKWFMAFNSFLIRVSGGRLGSKLGSQTILILHTVGRRSGTARSTPIAYFEYKDKYLLVGSNWGRDKQADWYVNLKKEPRAKIDVKGKKIKVKAREALGDEYDTLWKFATEKHPQYLDYQKMTKRRIPIVTLDPIVEK